MLEKTRRCHSPVADDSHAPRWLRGSSPAAVGRRWRAVRSALLATLGLLGGWLGQANPAAAADDPSPEIGHTPEPWPHLFPLLGKGAASKGIRLPQPIGVGLNYMYLIQDINIDRISLSLNDNPPQEANFIKFQRVRSSASMLTVRPDLWILPFLNVYGIAGAGHAKTTVSLEAPVALESVVEQTASVWGFGLTGAFGFDGFWLSADVNWTWVQLQNLLDPVSGRVLGLRLGKAFRFPGSHSLSVWGGAMQQSLKATTRGSLRMDEALSPEDLDQLGQALDTACDSLSGAAAAGCEILAGQYDPEAFGANEVHYNLDKSLKTPWNALIGAQYGFEPNWYIRTEVGFIGRYSVLLSANYRFGLGLKP